MSTSPALALAAALLAGAPDSGPSAFEVAVGAEVTLIGLTYGGRAELLFRPGEVGTASRLRLAAGLLPGPEHTFVPVSVGYRATYRGGLRVQPSVGAGLEFQQRFVSDFPTVRQLAAYLEGGVAFLLAPRWTAGLMLTVDVSFLGGPGAGLGPRLFVVWQL